MKTIAFMPVRGGSKSIPGKNIKEFCGKPLLYWQLASLESCSAVDEIIIATDCDTIKKTVFSFKLNKTKFFDRDPKNAQDSSSTEDVMLEYIKKSSLHNNDIFILSQATSPFATSDDYSRALDKFNQSMSDALLSVARVKRFFWSDDYKPMNYDFMNRPRRQDFSGVCIENGAFYISRVKDIIESRNRISGNIIFYEMPEYSSVELDEIDDWFIAEHYMRKYNLNYKNKNKIKLFITDVDGVLTDSGMYYSNSGEELKKFNTHDGMGISFLKENNIKIAIITTENTEIVSRRAKKLNIDNVFQGITDKLKCAKDLCDKLDISLDDVAYIGDDLNDIKLLQNVGIAACPANSVESVKKIAGILQLEKCGGDGAVREFIELLLNPSN